MTPSWPKPPKGLGQKNSLNQQGRNLEERRVGDPRSAVGAIIETRMHAHAHTQAIDVFQTSLKQLSYPLFCTTELSAFKIPLLVGFPHLVHLNEPIHMFSWVYVPLRILRDLEAYTYNHTTGHRALHFDSGLNVMVWFHLLNTPFCTYPCKMLLWIILTHAKSLNLESSHWA